MNIYTAYCKRTLITLLCTGTSSLALASTPSVTCRVELDRDVLQAEQNQRAVVKITLDAPKPPTKSNRPAVNLSIVLDRSGSMSGQKLEKAKDAAIQALRRLDARDIFSLVIYDNNVQTIVPAQSAANTEWIENQIRNISPGGNTALFGGVSQGAAEIRRNLEGQYVHRIILLSDGLANVGPSSPADLGRLGAGMIKEGISVTTIGVGTDYNEDLMAQLAQKSDGNTYFVEESRDLVRIFDTELGDVLSIVAQKVNLTIECPNGVRPLRVIGREGRIIGNHVELFLNQLYGGQEKYALIEVEVSSGKHGETREIASARVSYENPFTQKEESSLASGSGRYSSDKDEVQQSMNIEVEKAGVITLNAIAQEEAIRLSDEGKKKEAAQVLMQSAEQLRTLGGKLNDKEIIQEAEEQEDAADQVKQQGMSFGVRKSFRAKSYQDINQQQNKK